MAKLQPGVNDLAAINPAVIVKIIALPVAGCRVLIWCGCLE